MKKKHIADVVMNIVDIYLLLIKESRIDKKLNKIYPGIEIWFIECKVVIMKY